MRRLVWLIAAIALSVPCFAQNAPNIGMDMTSTTAPLRPEQKATLEQYIDAYLNALMGEDVESASRARGQLVDLMRRPGVTAAFRDEYSRMLIPKLTPVVQQQDNHFAAINAMQIAAQVKTLESMRLGVNHVSERNEPREAVRVWAAIAVRLAATQLAGNPVFARMVDTATRDVARAAKEETDWRVLLRQLQMLGSLQTPVAGSEELDVLSTIADRMARENGPSELIHAVFPAVMSLRDRVLDNRLAPAAAANMGKALAPVLGEVLEVARAHFDSAQQSEASRGTYGNLVTVTEVTIQRIDSLVAPPTQRAPQTQLRESWEKKDKARFNQGVEQWMERFESAVYKRSP
jgi:hypothetical protein